MGDHAPLLRLVDLESSEPLLLLGLKGHVVWVVFWSAEAGDASQNLAAIARATSKLRAHRLFTMVTAAIEVDKPEKVRAAIAAGGVDLPVYLASAESRLKFGVDNAGLPLNVLIDADGKIMLMARGADEATLERIAAMARHRLAELDPQGNTRFAFVVRHLRTLGGYSRACWSQMPPSTRRMAPVM